MPGRGNEKRAINTVKTDGMCVRWLEPGGGLAAFSRACISFRFACMRFTTTLVLTIVVVVVVVVVVVAVVLYLVYRRFSAEKGGDQFSMVHRSTRKDIVVSWQWSALI